MQSPKLMGQFVLHGTSIQAMERYKRHTYVISFTVDGRVRYLSAEKKDVMEDWARAIYEESIRSPS